MEIGYEEYCMKYNWCMHHNPYTMPEGVRKPSHQNVVSIPFDQMAAKDLETIKQSRKNKKIEQKRVRYE